MIFRKSNKGNTRHDDILVIRDQTTMDYTPTDYRGVIHLDNDRIWIHIDGRYPNATFVAINKTVVDVDCGNHIIARDESKVRLKNASEYDTFIEAYDYASVVARVDNNYHMIRIHAYDSTVIHASSHVWVEARHRCEVHAEGCCYVTASGCTDVVAEDYAVITARGRSTVWVKSFDAVVNAYDWAYVYGLGHNMGRIQTCDNSRSVITAHTTKPIVGAHYLVAMRPRRGIPGFISYECSNDMVVYVECILQEHYLGGTDYKVLLVPVDEDAPFGTEEMYTDTFESKISYGGIVHMWLGWEEGSIDVWREPLTSDGKIYLEHMSPVVVENLDRKYTH